MLQTHLARCTLGACLKSVQFKIQIYKKTQKYLIGTKCLVCLPKKYRSILSLIFLTVFGEINANHRWWQEKTPPDLPGEAVLVNCVYNVVGELFPPHSDVLIGEGSLTQSRVVFCKLA